MHALGGGGGGLHDREQGNRPRAVINGIRVVVVVVVICQSPLQIRPRVYSTACFFLSFNAYM